ncbi:MAG: histidine kinase dimerization/phospho-acceptor domain-containing protein [Pseudomonadota bacterium]
MSTRPVQYHRKPQEAAPMFFDDRLTTVLRQEGSSEAARRTQFRQLLDILGNRKFGPAGRTDPSLVAAAWLRMDALGRSIPAKERAAMIREPSWRFRSADLAAHLADFEPEVASAAVNRAQLGSDDWIALIPRLPLVARGFLRLRRDLPLDANAMLDQLGVYDRGLPVPGPAPAPMDPPAPEAAEPIINDNEAPEPLTLDKPLELSAETVVDFEPAPKPDGDQKPAAIDPIEAGRSEISALVERIALFRKTRENLDPDDLTDSERSPRLPLDEGQDAPTRRLSGFAFSTNAAGRIDWAEGEAAAMVIGTKLISPQALGVALDETDKNAAITRAFLQRQPIQAAQTELVGAPAIAGEWSLDAQPSFTPEGQFTGYVGRYRRLAEDDPEDWEQTTQEADRIRQLLHELRTPVTAVQGYAEVIQQQLFGPAPHEYRALAAAIAADAAFILAGFEELDRLARLEIGTLGLEPGESDLAAIARQTERQLAPVLAPRQAGLAISVQDSARCLVPIDTEDTERLVWRFLATLAGACDRDEKLVGELSVQGESLRLTADLPQSLLGAEDVFANTAKPVESAINAGVFGAGFALRLARAEARASGGNLRRNGDRIALSLPRLEQGEAPASLTRP